MLESRTAVGNTRNSLDGRVEVNPDLAAPARYLLMMNPEVLAEPTANEN